MWALLAELVVVAVVTEAVDRLMKDQPPGLANAVNLPDWKINVIREEKNMFERLLVVAIAAAIRRAVENATKK